MTLVTIRHRVQDFDQWLPKFQEHESVRREYDLRTVGVHRRHDEPNDVLIIFEVPNPGRAAKFLEESDVGQRMKEAGVSEEPEVRIWQESLV